MKQYHALFSGQVQGVGFRYTCHRIARRHNVRGWVRNLHDGRVEICLQGESNEIDRYLADLRQQMAGYIERVEGEFEEGTEELNGFDIRF
jgi:acylphosphatase